MTFKLRCQKRASFGPPVFLRISWSCGTCQLPSFSHNQCHYNGVEEENKYCTGFPIYSLPLPLPTSQFSGKVANLQAEFLKCYPSGDYCVRSMYFNWWDDAQPIIVEKNLDSCRQSIPSPNHCKCRKYNNWSSSLHFLEILLFYSNGNNAGDGIVNSTFGMSYCKRFDFGKWKYISMLI